MYGLGNMYYLANQALTFTRSDVMKTVLDAAEEIQPPLFPMVADVDDEWSKNFLYFEADILDELIGFLSSSVFPQVGPKRAGAVVKAFGIETPEIIVNNPDKLKAVKGIGESLQEAIVKGWGTQNKIKLACSALSQIVFKHKI